LISGTFAKWDRVPGYVSLFFSQKNVALHKAGSGSDYLVGEAESG